MGFKIVFSAAIVLLLSQFVRSIIAGRSVSMDPYDDDDARDMQDYIEAEGFLDSLFGKANPYGSSLDCAVRNPGETDDVNRLSPFNVNVVAALGDSLTAGFGGGTRSILEVYFNRMEYKGISWSIGGKSTLSRVTTLPNILKKFNPRLYGFSTEITKFHGREAFNGAVSGARVRDLLGQAKDLVNQMKIKRKLNEWKVITIFIGSNDLCAKSTCQNRIFETVDDYMYHLHEALKYLSKSVKKAFINLALLLDVSIVAPLSGLICDTVHRKHCPCATGKLRNIASEVAKEINSEIVRKYQDRQPFDRKDFAVVVQPLFSKTRLPLKREIIQYEVRQNFNIGNSDGVVQPMKWRYVPDTEFLAPDCFHFSQKTHTLVARILWKNMLEPVGSKTDSIEWQQTRELVCPNKNFPYFRTNKNSKWNV